MNLRTLLSLLEKYDAYGNLDVELTGLAYDSRKVQPGNLFAALPGVNFHGAQFLKNAEAAGAAAILTNIAVDTALPRVYVDSPRYALALLSHEYYGRPSTKLRLFGATGTNGKTTSTFLLHSVLEQAGLTAGLLGTVQYRGPKFKKASSLTTPESLDLQQMFSAMAESGCDACVMEVSSHSLTQYRVAGCNFESMIFTNLTQDHLDYHKTMEDYFQAKWMVFENEICKTQMASINQDDPYGQRILAQREELGYKSVSYGFSENANYRIVQWTTGPTGSDLVIQHKSLRTMLNSPLMARFNAYNVAGVFASLHSCGIAAEVIARGIENMKQVPGRLERIDHGQPYLIFIDYAHTDDALRQLLQTVRTYTQKKLTVLFGCGGDRDRGKRPLMGEVAGQLADEIIISSDNPRNEDPNEIAKDVLLGVTRSNNKNVQIILDRADAIRFALAKMEPGDVLVLAGKGHENYQAIGNEKIHFDEREVLAEALGGSTHEANC